MRLENHINLLSQKWKKKYNTKVMKVGLSLGLTCPNRTKGGCIFCLPSTFIDEVNDTRNLTLQEQIAIILPKIKDKTNTTKFIAYLQDETSTACSPNFLKEKLQFIENTSLFQEIIISTRPDYLNSDIIEVIQNISLPITIEIGLQTIHDSSLNFLRRNHTHNDSIKALDFCRKANIPCGVHLILGIPGESDTMINETISFVNNDDNIKDIKLHNLVVYNNTPLAKIYKDYSFLSYRDYLEILSQVIANVDSKKTISRLFTSNLRKDQVALNPFPGIKQIWLKDFWLLLIEKNIFQGSCKQEDNVKS